MKSATIDINVKLQREWRFRMIVIICQYLLIKAEKYATYFRDLSNKDGNLKAFLS